MSKQEPFWDAYVHHETEQAMADVPDGARLFQPVFIRLRDATWQACRDELTNWLDHLSDGLAPVRPASMCFLRGILLDPADVAVGIEAANATQSPPEFFVYCKVGETIAPDAAEIIDVGPPVHVRASYGCGAVKSRPPQVPAAKGVVGAVIDTNIGFLHERFRTAKNQTRFSALWLQTKTKTADLQTGTLCTDLITAVEIDRLISGTFLTENEIYGVLNEDLFEDPTYQRPLPRTTHGTAVADVAFGADEGEVNAGIPLLGVQIPPEAAQDTTGTTSESFIVEGVRWLCAQARQTFPGHELVINISLGVLAGQKDGGRFIEEQIRRELETAERLGQTVHAVFAFGNSRNSRQVAELACGAEAESLNWVIQPDNVGASILEIYAQDGTLASLPSGVELKLVDPDGAVLTYQTDDQGSSLIDDSQNTGARIYDTPARAFSDATRPEYHRYLCVLVSPTVQEIGTPNAKAGTWTLSMRKPQGEPLDLVLQIQRGDTAPGFPAGGRQSFFEGPLVANPDLEGDLTVQAPLTNDGTNSAYSTAKHPRYHAIAASQSRFGDVAPSAYSAIGATWSGGPAGASMIVDQPYTMGVTAAGTVSGAQTRLSGTSAAAALFSRSLVEQLIATR